MKKINLKGLNEVLSEKEMKNVMGGSRGLCYKCSNGNEGVCPTGSCGSYLENNCLGGWMQWECGY